MLGLNSPNKYPHIPEGFVLLRSELIAVRKINKLLSRCNQDAHQPRKLELALKNSDFYLTLLEKTSDNLVGFVRVTSDKGLNANLWDLVAEPGDQQEKYISIVVFKAIEIIRRELPGCSISVAAPLISLKALEANGFLLDPNGIKTMGVRL
ncbi:N-acetyltransferase [Prochlorococcus sp. MIT 0916]|uniref:GNAT family acetyltransferase n=1 Tax=Prochlorococcus marinus str. P0903-H212 TaxID=1622208 RepID=A0A0D5A2Y2_PROMR|nr:GNAT family acetyltransferase [Prochlorococcus marinus str. P0903-H212]